MFLVVLGYCYSDQHYSASCEQNALKFYGQIRGGAKKN